MELAVQHREKQERQNKSGKSEKRGWGILFSEKEYYGLNTIKR